MSRGHGSVQRAIVSSLQKLREEEVAPPLAWFTQKALGLAAVDRSSFSRAAVGLHRAGLIERAVAWLHEEPSTNPYYRHARVPSEAEEWHGVRLRLVVRLAVDAAQEAEWTTAWERFDAMRPGSWMHFAYLRWLYARDMQGVVPVTGDGGGDFQPLSPEGSQEQVRHLIAAPGRPARTPGA